MSGKKWRIATDEASLQRRYREYLERHDSYYPERPRMGYEEFKVWDLRWAREYETLWDRVNEYMNRNGLVLEFSKAPDWPRIVELETRLCV